MSSSISRINPAAGAAIGGIKGIIEVLRALKAASLSNPWTAILTVAVSLVTALVVNWEKIKNFISGSKRNRKNLMKFLKKLKVNKNQ